MTAQVTPESVARKRAEHLVFDELLKLGIVPHVPAVEVGYDALVRTSQGHALEVWVNSNEGVQSGHPRRFIVSDFEPDPCVFIVCVALISDGNEEAWVFPSMVFYAYSNPVEQDKTCCLDLDLGEEEYGNPLTDHLCGFRNRWEIISNYEEWRRFMTSSEGYEDLEDILATKEAQESPEEERMSFDEYVRSLPETI